MLSFPSPGGEGEAWDVLICDGDPYHRRTCDRGEGVRGGEDRDIPTVQRPAEILVRRVGRVVCPNSDQTFQDDTLRLRSAGIAFTDAEGGVHRFMPVDASRGCDTTFRSVTDHPERIQVVMPEMAWCRVVYAHNERYTIVCSGR